MELNLFFSVFALILTASASNRLQAPPKHLQQDGDALTYSKPQSIGQGHEAYHNPQQSHFGFRMNYTLSQRQGSKIQVSLGINNLTWLDSVRLHDFSDKSYKDVSLLEMYTYYDRRNESARRTELKGEASALLNNLPRSASKTLVPRDTPTSSALATTSTWPYGEGMRAAAVTLGEVPFQGAALTLSFLGVFFFWNKGGTEKTIPKRLHDLAAWLEWYNYKSLLRVYDDFDRSEGNVLQRPWVPVEYTVRSPLPGPGYFFEETDMFFPDPTQPITETDFRSAVAFAIDALWQVTVSKEFKWSESGPLVLGPLLYTMLKAVWNYLDRTQRLEPYYALIAKVLLAIAAAAKQTCHAIKALPKKIKIPTSRATASPTIEPTSEPTADPAIELTNIIIKCDGTLFVRHNATQTSTSSDAGEGSSLPRVPRPAQPQQTFANKVNDTLEEISVLTGDDVRSPDEAALATDSVLSGRLGTILGSLEEGRAASAEPQDRESIKGRSSPSALRMRHGWPKAPLFKAWSK